jgi:hypothetical protein
MNIRVVLFALAACATLCAIPWPASGKIFPMIFETNLRGSGLLGDEPSATPGTGTVGMYDGKTGTFDPAFVQDLNTPQAIAVGADNLFVVNSVGGKFGVSIGEYSALTGAVINSHLIAGLHGRVGIAAFGDNLFVTSASTHRIDEYSATTGDLIQGGFIMGLKLKGPAELAVAGGNLFVVNSTAGKGSESIGQYDAATGATLNPSLVPKLHGRVDIAVFGTNLFVTNVPNHSIDEYDAVTGMLIKPGFVTELHGSSDIAVFGGDLFVTDAQNQSIDIFNAMTGVSEGMLLQGRLHGPQGITIIPVSGSVPDASSSWLLLLLGLIAAFGFKGIVRQPA